MKLEQLFYFNQGHIMQLKVLLRFLKETMLGDFRV